MFFSSAHALGAARSTTRGRKGELTHAAILEAALAIAQRDGMEGLTIGLLAERLGMSKSGVFAHFGSREDLQLAVLQEYAARFVERVLRPAVRRARGLPRVRAMVDRWLALLAEELEAGCILIGGATEYDDRPGALHDALAAIISSWKGELVRALEQAKSCGHLRGDVDLEQMVFEIYGLMLMLHQDARLLHGKDSVRRARCGLQRILDNARTEAGAAAVRRRKFAGEATAGKTAKAN
ncbi:MAG TPA: TetR/AcrR family transcriptional regulator [Burkholderiaceae bacterium]|nr:TetR/AcrR family transcriptional regulator [Burkholderiaceae bacterium]